MSFGPPTGFFAPPAGATFVDYRTGIAAEWWADNIAGSTGDIVELWPETIASSDAVDGVANSPELRVAQVNGRNAVRFTNNHRLDSPYAETLGDFTIFAVFKQTSTPVSGGYGMFSKGYFNHLWIGDIGIADGGEGIGIGCKKGGTPPYLTPLSGTAVNAWHVISGRRSGTQWQVRRGGTVETNNATVSSDVMSSDAVIFGSTPVSGFWYGDIALVRIYNTALSDVNRLLVEQFLGQHYNITVTP